MISQEQAAEVANSHLSKKENNIVHVNQHGLIWMNNDKEHMEKYFKSKNEKFWVFEKQAAEPSEEETESPKKARKKQD